MATDVQIASLALTRIGHEGISSFSASGDKAQRWFAANYDFIRLSLLREYEWRFATRQTIVSNGGRTDITGATQADPVVITAAGHGIASGATVYIAGVIGMTEINGLTFTAANATANTLELEGIDGTAYAAYTSGGILYSYVAEQYAYRYSIPTDCLRLLRINGGDDTEHRVQHGNIYTNESGPLHLEYIYDEDDEARFNAQFVDLFAARLSAEISFYLTDNSTLTEQAWNIYNQKLSMARTMDSRQGTPRGIEADGWLTARI